MHKGFRTRTRCAAAAVALAAGLGGTLLAPAAGAAPTARPHSAPAAPQVKAPGFNASGTWTMYQSTGIDATLTLTQDARGNLSGTATDSRSTGTVTEGFVDGEYISFLIDWADGREGRCIGSLQPDRRLRGVSTDLAHPGSPGSEATWHTTRTF
ncbi:hypothetical protein [Streptomyces sp. G45]|uniref:hypothetical protein n=1 Tax=Streptomyces sp. G45 TaxID=3406627 RepID=UPI003C28CBA5